MQGEGVKSLMACVLLLGLLLGRIQAQYRPSDVEACCPSTKARRIYEECRTERVHSLICCHQAGCKAVDEPAPCQPPYDYPARHSPKLDESDALKFCKLGCTSSMCNNISTIVDSEGGIDAVDRCNNACYRFCAKQADIASIAAYYLRFVM